MSKTETRTVHSLWGAVRGQGRLVWWLGSLLEARGLFEKIRNYLRLSGDLAAPLYWAPAPAIPS
ncbi:hypothetical protein SATMO3_60010 [Sporomusa aerivorans]